MDTRDTIEIAALLSSHAATLVESPLETNEDALRRVWQLGRRRVEDWLRRLHDANESSEPSAPLAAATVTRELLTSDVLARTWIAVLLARAERVGDVDLRSVARNLLLGRLRARRFVMRWLLDEPRLDEAVLVSVDRLRRRTERWTDLLLAPLTHRFDVADVAFDVERSCEFARDELGDAVHDPGEGVWQLLVTGIRVAFDDLPDTDAARRANARFVGAILESIPADLFELDGTLRPLTFTRTRRDGSRVDDAIRPGTDLLLSLLQPRFGEPPGRG